MLKRIYIAATSQHIGKTTSTLGLVKLLKKKGYNVGYCKPVGQEGVLNESTGVYADKDAVLFAQVMEFEMEPQIHSPVILGPGATQQYLDNPSNYDFEGDIFRAAEILEKKHEIIIFEGTGHPGVGSVVNLSNAEVAQKLGASVILVVEGGVGNTIDRLNLSLSLFREQKVPIIGVIVNKVLIDKLDKVKHYVGIKLKEWGIPLLGVMPYDKTLLYPLFDTVCKAIDGRYLHNFDQRYNRVEKVLAASLVDTHTFKEDASVLLVVSANRVNEVVSKIHQKTTHLSKCPLAGIVITGDGRLEEWSEAFGCEGYILTHQIPVVATRLDTYGSALQISRIEVKINTRTPWKTEKAREMIEEHVNLSAIIDAN